MSPAAKSSAATIKRRRRVEFLDFMKPVVAAHPQREIHVVLDNFSTHKPTHDMWLKRHKNVHFPLHADPRLLAQAKSRTPSSLSGLAASTGMQ
jgi:hypothetical protein